MVGWRDCFINPKTLTRPHQQARLTFGLRNYCRTALFTNSWRRNQENLAWLSAIVKVIWKDHQGNKGGFKRKRIGWSLFGCWYLLDLVECQFRWKKGTIQARSNQRYIKHLKIHRPIRRVQRQIGSFGNFRFRMRN